MRTFAASLLVAIALPAAAQTCSARSGAEAPRVVELYTSEGCSSCPPADRWLSSVHRLSDVLALAFHVDYWDRLGWKDRFASAEHTARQYRLRAAAGAGFVYTPQVLVDGVDWRRWPALPAAQPSRVDIELRREGSAVEAVLTPRAGAPTQLAGYWTAFEDGHVSAVRSGENAGATLHHDAVVRAYRELPPWSAGAPTRLRFEPPPAERPGGIALVLVDARTQRPVAAARLRC